MSESLARAERRQLCELLATLGPDAPTLPEGWTAHHLAAHLRLRETDPVAALGIFFPPMARITERRMARLMTTVDFDELVGLIADGPGGANPMRLGRVDSAVNTLEFFVHHEDLRRGGDFVVRPRALDEATNDQLWELAIRTAVRKFMRMRLGVVLQRLRDGRPADEQAVVSIGRTPVTVLGEPGELIMWLFGRERAAEVQFTGPADGLARLRRKSMRV